MRLSSARSCALCSEVAVIVPAWISSAASGVPSTPKARVPESLDGFESTGTLSAISRHLRTIDGRPSPTSDTPATQAVAHAATELRQGKFWNHPTVSRPGLRST